MNGVETEFGWEYLIGFNWGMVVLGNVWKKRRSSLHVIIVVKIGFIGRVYFTERENETEYGIIKK